MKKLFYYSIIALACFALNKKATAQNANTSLSNLIKTKINQNLFPKTTNTYNLGADDSAWKNLFLAGSIYLDNKRFISNIGTENTFIGANAGKSNTTGSYNMASGYYASYNNTTGQYNTAVGDEALYNNQIGWENTALGKGALFSNIGFYNTASGYAALNGNTDGDYNLANGVSALLKNTTGSYNTALGADALYHNTTGINNTAAGSDALFNNTGNDNTAIGFEALVNTTSAAYNTSIGFQAGDSYDNGFNNVFVGANVDVTGPGFYNVIAIGQGTVCTDVSQVTMGNGATATYRAYANWTNISDGRFKKNIKENVPGLEFINKLQPITYTLDATGIDNFLHKDLPQDKQFSEKAKAVMNKALAEKEKTIFTGFVAQDVEKAAKSLNYDFSGVDAAKNNKDLYGLRYAEFVVPLVKAVQELSRMNDDKDAKIDNLQKQIDALKAMMVSNRSTVNGQPSTVLSSASLEQNIPNPFTNSSTINYTLPQKFNSAQLVITDKNGKTLKTVNVSDSGKGNITVNASTLASGAYQYSLIIDRKLIATKQMILAK